MATAKQSEAARDELLAFVRKTEETITEAGRKLGETMSYLVPGDRESIRRVVDEAFDFTERILQSQREFAGRLLDSMLGEASAKSAPAAKRRPATAAATRPVRKAAKSPARKSTRRGAA